MKSAIPRVGASNRYLDDRQQSLKDTRPAVRPAAVQIADPWPAVVQIADLIPMTPLLCHPTMSPCALAPPPLPLLHPAPPHQHRAHRNKCSILKTNLLYG
jgi:hypothetical protein